MTITAVAKTATPTVEEQIAQLIAENAALKATAAAKSIAKNLSFKVSEKGALSVYGMGRFPVTLYVEQWDRLMAHGDDLKTFIAANAGRFTMKADKIVA